MHHIEQVDKKYCTVFPISNYVLDTILFWRLLENCIKLFGIQPDRKEKYNHYKKIHTYMHEDAKNECPQHPTKKNVNMLFKELDNFIKC